MDFGTLTLYRRGEQPQPFRLRLGSLSIGSDPSADISIDDSLLDRFHARVVCTPAGCQLTDLDSKGGTLVNKERLRPHAPHLLRDGDRIQLGRVGLLYAAPARPGSRPTTSAEGATSSAEGATSSAESATTSGERPTTSGDLPTTSAERPTTSAASATTSAESATTSAASATTSAESATTSAASATTSAESATTERPTTSGGRPPASGNLPSSGSSAAGAATIATRPERTTATAAPLDDWNALFQVPIVPAGGQGAGMLPGNRRRRRRQHDERDLPYEAEDYMALLPPIYHDDRFMRRFLLIFKTVLDPLDRQIAQIAHYFDPRTAPEHMLPWLAGWVDLVLDERWPEARRRELIGAASVLYRWRGTRRGLSDYLRIYTGVTPRIVEQGQEARGEPALAPHTFRVIIEAPDLAGVDRDLVERIIELERPAHTAYELELRATGGG